MEKIVNATAQLDLKGTTWVAEWNSYTRSDGTETPDRWLKILRKDADGLTPFEELSNISDEEYSRIVAAFAAQRVKTIQKEYGIPSPDLDEIDISEKILARVWAGEWMGQLHNSYYFFVENLASILGKDFPYILGLVDTLGVQRKAGLNGFIIVPWQEEENAYLSWEKQTGHKRLLVSDWGGWNCGHCGNSGDEYGPSPSKVACERKVG